MALVPSKDDDISRTEAEHFAGGHQFQLAGLTTEVLARAGRVGHADQTRPRQQFQTLEGGGR